MKFGTLSGSLTKLSDGTSYLIAGNNIAIASGVNGSVAISAAGTTPGGSNTQVQFNDSDSFGGSSLFTYNKTTGAVTASYFVGNGGGLTQLTASQLYVTGAATVDGYLQLLPVGNANIPTNQTASYIYTSGSTNDLYFTQYQPGTGYTNTTRLRWLESVLSTGLLHGGVLSTANGTSTFSITSGSGLIISYNASVGSDPYPTVKFVQWPAYTSSSLPDIGTKQITYIGISNTGALEKRTSPFAGVDFENYIVIGRVLHQAGSVTNGVITSPTTAYGNLQWFNDFSRAFGPLKISGHTLSAAGTNLQLVKTAGNSIVSGRNYTSNPNSPNLVLSSTDTALLTSKIFREYTNGSGEPIILSNNNAGYTDVDPTQYNNGGTLASVNAGNYTIQRVYWFPNSVNRALFIYYGTQEYATIDLAEAGIASENFTEGANTAEAAILVGFLIVKGNATNLQNATQAKIVQAGISRSASGGGASSVAVLPGGSDTYVQFNDGGSSFGGDAGMTYNKTTDTLTVGNVSIGDTGLLSTTGTTANVFNTTATTVNFAGEASTALNVGHSSGTNIISGTTKFSQGISGSLTRLADGTSYLIAGAGIGIATGSSGAVTFTATPAGSTSQVQYNSAGTFGASSTLTFDSTNNILATINASTTSVTASNIMAAGSTVNLFNTTATTLNIGGSAAALSMGSGGGVMTLNGIITGSSDLNILVGSTNLARVKEKLNTKTGTGIAFTYDCSTGHIFYQSGMNSNFTANFSNISLTPGFATACTLVLSQSAAAYIPTAVQIDGVAASLNWQGSAQPSGTANKKDIVSFSVLNVSSSYIVMGQLVSFG